MSDSENNIYSESNGLTVSTDSNAETIKSIETIGNIETIKSSKDKILLNGDKEMEYKGKMISPQMYQRVCYKEHFMIKYKGFGISHEILDRLTEDRVKFIMFIYIGTNGPESYLATTRQFTQSEKNHRNGDDLQYFVSLSEMLKL